MRLTIPDIADSGLAQAYTAWKSSLSHSSEDKDKDAPLRLPGLDYTPDQLFFIAFARVWEQLTRPATAVVRVRTDPHSPPYWRATGTLRNLGAFHEAFECKVGSKVSFSR
jgi:endothelin-converting enzyme